MSEIELVQNIDSEIIKIRTKTLDVSFNEIYDMFRDGELIIDPKYQRLFRWSEEAQSRFIESLILEMPVPPIFVIEKEDGIYELIDGLQRISSYLHFRGENIKEESFNNEVASMDGKGKILENTSKDNSLVLNGCDIVKNLNGYCYATLPQALKIKLKRSFVRMEVIKKESDQTLKYHMFKRLNTGGELLSDQEIRNCTIRLLGEKGIDFIAECASNEKFKIVTQKISSIQARKMYDQELVLRFFAIKNDIESFKYSTSDYLTNYLEKMTKGDFDFRKEKYVFDKTFDFVSQLDDDILSSKTAHGSTKNDLALYYYDGICISISKNIDNINGNIKAINEALRNAKFELPAKYRTGSSYGVRGRIEYFSNIIGNL